MSPTQPSGGARSRSARQRTRGTHEPDRNAQPDGAYRDHPGGHHVPGTFEAGPLIAVVEPNGAGKSNLLGAIAGQLKHAGCGRNSGRGCRTRSWNTR